MNKSEEETPKRDSPLDRLVMLPLNKEQQKQVDDFKKVMEAKVIPEIVNTIHRRHVLAANSRCKILRAT